MYHLYRPSLGQGSDQITAMTKNVALSFSALIGCASPLFWFFSKVRDRADDPLISQRGSSRHASAYSNFSTACFGSNTPPSGFRWRAGSDGARLWRNGAPYWLTLGLAAAHRSSQNLLSRSFFPYIDVCMYVFLWLCQVLIAAGRIFSCIM